jgi:hypothetical protein
MEDTGLGALTLCLSVAYSSGRGECSMYVYINHDFDHSEIKLNLKGLVVQYMPCFVYFYIL